MCRGTVEGARRCPCDTSEARRLRRLNNDAVNKYAPLISSEEKVDNETLTVLEENLSKGFTVEDIRSDIEELNSLDKQLLSIVDRQKAYDSILNRIGLGVEYLAESKYGAPLDSTIREISDTEKKNHVEELTKLKTVTENLYEQLVDTETFLMNTEYNLKTYPSILKREQKWSENYPKEYEQRRQLDADLTEAYKKFNTVKENGIPFDETDELFKKRNNAIRDALAEVGVKFADPETLAVAEDSHKDAMVSLKEALRFYPQKWVDNSNQHSEHNMIPLRIKRSQGRAHYSPKRLQKGFSHTPRIMMNQKPDSWKPDPYDRQEQCYLPTNELGEYVEPTSGIVYSQDTEPGFTSWAYVSYDYSSETSKPGRGWEPITYQDTRYNSETKQLEKLPELTHGWRKMRTRKTNNSMSYKAELLVTKDGEPSHTNSNPGFRVALHEFAHRVEDSTQLIKNYENAFLLRRAGYHNDEGEPLESIYKQKVGRNAEMGYKDNFATHYMGKVYDNGSREILSMGMETLFSGRNGGFVGADNINPDPDYKRFILGVLASSAETTKGS